MRTPLFVKVERFNWDDVAEEIKAIRNDFDRYLDSYPVKTARSKHSLMGPVGKVLQEAGTGRWDANSLAGFALNIHLSNPRAKGFISEEARNALQDGIARLLDLLNGVPVTAQDKVLDRIDYGLYFLRRTKGLDWLERVRQDFQAFLRAKYGTPESLASSWGGSAADYGPNFARVPFPSKQQFNEAEGQKKNDMAEFARQAELKGYELPEDDELEEETR